MSAEIVSGTAIADKILKRIKGRARHLPIKPHLAVVLVGSDRASLTYIRKKQEAAERVGVGFTLYRFPESLAEEDLIAELRQIQAGNLSGIIVQLPLPAGLDKRLILNELKSDLDVDYLSWESLGKLVIGENQLVPPTPGAVLEILKQHKVNLTGKHVVVVGVGDLIGKPLCNLLMQLPVTLSVCNKQTKNLKAITLQADVLVTGVGKRNLIRGSMIKPGAVVIDAGVSFAGKKLYGDVNFAEASRVASLLTPTPGGVGPVTVAKLLENTVLAAENKARGGTVAKL